MNQPLAVHVSNRQYNVLRETLQSNGISLNRMIHISQTTVGGLFRRGYMAWNKKAGLFQLTKLGVECMKQYSFTNVDRLNEKRPLSKFVPGREAFRVERKAKKAVA
jgi:hypothetical protein